MQVIFTFSKSRRPVRPEMSVRESAIDLLRAGEVADALRLLQENTRDPAAQVLLREHLVGEGLLDQAMPLIERLSGEHGSEAHVSRSIVALLQGDVQTAARECEAALRKDPNSATAHNHLGRALHNQGRSEAAIRAFGQAVELDPGYAQAWSNLGHVQRAIGRLPESVEAYQRALAQAPGYQSARLNLGISWSLLEQPDRALACFEELLQADPGHVEAMVNAGLALHVLGRIPEARKRLEQALERAPGHANAWCYLGVLLNEQLDTEGALEALHKALELNPGDIEARVELAGVLEQSNRLDEAQAAVQAGLDRDPHHPALKLEAARLARRNGDATTALALLRGLRPDRLPARLAQQAWFELGQALDRNGEWDEAYDAFAAGNRLAAQSPRRAQIDPHGFEQRCEAIEQWLSGGAPGIAPGPGELAGDTGADLCFLLGFPRSGTTLLDTFLGALPEVQSVEERPTLEAVIEVLRAAEPGYPAALQSLSAEEVADLRRAYREALERHAGPRPAAAKWVLDKLPMRSLNVGLIQRLFPRARLLFALRHPCDVVLSNFMQSYADNEAFIHFDTLADSAAMYHRVMSVWRAYQPFLGLDCLLTRYEDLVDDPRTELERVCRFLDLEPTEEMLDTEARLANRGRIRTNSYQQVAEPVYSRSRGRWENYAGHFNTVLPVLQPWIKQFGYAEPAGDQG